MLSHPVPAKLSPDLLKALHGISSVRLFPKGTTLFQRGSEVTGFYVVETGKVHVLLLTGRGQNQLLEVVGPGAVLGLSESITGGEYRITAEAGDETTATYIPREEFLEFLRAHGESCMQVLRLLSQDLHRWYGEYRNATAHSGRPRHWPLDVPLKIT